MSSNQENWKSFKGVKLPPKVRWFTFTNHDTDFDYDTLDMNKFRWVGKGRETAPTTGKLHDQGFFYVRDATAWGKTALRNLGKHFNGAHVEPMISKILNNEYYCSKEGTLEEWGIMPKQGLRDDIKECVDEVVAGNLTPNQVCVENPGFYHQYGRTLEKAYEIGLRKQFRTWMTTCTWWTGPSNSGKSHNAFKDFHPDTHFVLEFDDGGFWENYKGQETVILNEFRGEIRFSKLLALIDKWPMYVKQKGKGTFPFLAKHIHITSVKTPEEVYKNSLDEDEKRNWEQWTRRVKVVKLEARKTEQKCSEGNTGTSEPNEETETEDDSDDEEIVQYRSEILPRTVPTPSGCASRNPPDGGVLLSGHPGKCSLHYHEGKKVKPIPKAPPGAAAAGACVPQTANARCARSPPCTVVEFD